MIWTIVLRLGQSTYIGTISFTDQTEAKVRSMDLSFRLLITYMNFRREVSMTIQIKD